MKRRDLGLSALATYLVQAYVAVFFLYPVALQQEGIPLTLVGGLLGAYFGATTLGRPLGGVMVERLGVRWALILSGVGLVLTTTPMIWVRSLGPLLLLRGGMGLFYGVAMVAVTAYQTAAIPAAVRGQVFAWIAVAYVLPQITVMPLGDFFLSRGGTELYLALAPVLALGCLGASLFSSDLPPATATPDQGWGSWGELLRVRPFYFVLASGAVFSLVNSSTLQYLSAAAAEKGLSSSAFFVANAASALAMRLLGSRVLDRFPRGILSGVMIALMGGVLVLFPRGDTHLFLGILGLVYGVGMGFGFPIQLALAPDFVPRHLLPKGVAGSFFVMDLAWIVTTVGAALLGTHWGMGGTLAGMGILGLGGGVLVAGAAWRLDKTCAGPRDDGKKD